MVAPLSRFFNSNIIYSMGVVALGSAIVYATYRVSCSIFSSSNTSTPSALKGSTMKLGNISSDKAITVMHVAPDTNPALLKLLGRDSYRDQIVICPPCGIHVLNVNHPVDVQKIDSNTTRITLKETGETWNIDNKVGAIFRIVIEAGKPVFKSEGSHQH